MKIENSDVFNFENALRGMRNPKNSWARSDSYYDGSTYIIGPNDMKLAQRLIQGGTEHRKFLRQIFVSADITAPLFIWKEIDTYKIGTTANSTSTMHTITDQPFVREQFEMDDYQRILLVPLNDKDKPSYDSEAYWDNALATLNKLRDLYLSTKDKDYWKELIRILPESWLQTRTWTANYEVLSNIYHQRENHKLSEWKTILGWIETLPYAKEFIIGG